MISAAFLTGTCGAYADDWYRENDGYFTVTDESGQFLFMIAAEVNIDDEYISGDNMRYRIVQVDEANNRAAARYIETIDFVLDAEVLAQQQNNKVAIYCTHSDESYVPTDGTESEPESGGVLDVAAQFRDALNQAGLEAEISEDTHEPHDAGAYRRSRRTATQLMKSVQPAVLLDIHRDAVPAEQYETDIEGREVSKVRIVIGRSNQNKAANEEFALAIKKIADEMYPGLIKDIFEGKGNYNQDLMPRAILFEIGTHTIEKERAQESTKHLAEVVAATLGVQSQNKQQAPAPENGRQPQGQQGQQQQQPDVQQQRAGERGAFKSVGWIIAVLVAAGILGLLLFVRKGERGEKFRGFWHEITGIGKRKQE